MSATPDPGSLAHLAAVLRAVEVYAAEARAGLRAAERISAESPKTALVRRLVDEIERLADSAWLAATS